MPTADMDTAWEALFANAPPDEQQRLLALAARQGLLYAHQLPAPGSNGQSPRQPSAPGLLTRLLSAPGPEACGLTPLVLSPRDRVEIDPGLDALQNDAVLRALATPDLFLLQGLPGSGESRVLAEIVAQSASRGLRVLLLAASAPALDRCLESLASKPAACVLRLLGRDEKLDSLPPTARDATLPGRIRQIQEQTLPSARRDLDETSTRLTQLEREGTALPRLLSLAEERRQIEGELGSLPARRERLAHEVSPESANGELHTANQARAESLQALEKDRARLTEQIQAERSRLEQNTALLASLRPLAEAKTHNRWWTLAWWKPTGGEDVSGRVAALEAELPAVRETLTKLEHQQRALAEAEARIETEFRAAVSHAVEVEVMRRREELDRHEKELRDRDARLRQEVEGLASAIAWSDFTPEAVAQAQSRWEEQRQAVVKQEAFQSRWVKCLEERAAEFESRLGKWCNVVAATVATFQAEKPASGFDLLVLAEADRLSEPDLVTLSRSAPRWILCGSEVSSQEPHRPSRNAPRAAPRPPLERLWQQLDCDTRRLTYTWYEEGDRLGCRLRPVSPEQAQWLESERVADSPDIELRILAQPGCEPALAEVVFPPSIPLAEAKAYIYRELQELAVEPHGRRPSWIEEPERFVIRLSEHSAEHACAVALDRGVCEQVVKNGHPSGASWKSCCIEFDKAAGWSWQAADEWVARNLGLRPLGRTARLDVLHRSHPHLRLFLSALLFDEDAGEETPAPGEAPVVEFVAVPAMEPLAGAPERGGHRGGRGGRTATLDRAATAAVGHRKGGAGFELDLADPRHRERIPAEVRGRLGLSGLVNYTEARAVVRALESLVEEHPVNSLSVVALYPAQADLIRSLILQSSSLKGTGVDAAVGTADTFRDRDSAVTLVSLTRSHTHRAVSFGGCPERLTVALTRARVRLLLFGDPGTLIRRSQWEQPLESLDHRAAAREHAIVSHLARYLRGEGRHPELFQVRASTDRESLA